MFDSARMREVRNGTAFLSSADDHGRASHPPIEWEGPNVRLYKVPRPYSYLTTEGDWNV